MKYLDIYVMISPARGGNYDVKARSEEGGEGNSKLELPFRLSELSPSIFGASSASRGTSFGDPETERLLSIETVGIELFEALFSRGTQDVLTRTEDVAKRRAEKTGVRIRLSMNLAAEGMAEVASLPWELMRRRDQDALVVSVSTPLVRAFDVATPIYFHPITGKLKILLLVSNPKGTAPLNLSQEKDRICKIWNELGSIEFVECRPEKRQILDLLSQRDFHVVHYMGHGNFDSGVGGQIIMEDADGNEQAISGTVFANWLHDQSLLRLVFLNACNTGATGEQTGLHPFAGVASALIGSGKPAVVAMQFPISDDAAIIFAETFYMRIAQGMPVEQAVSEGRKSLTDRVGSEWATPVLYMRAVDGELFDRSSDKAEAASDKPLAARPSAVQPDPSPVPEQQPVPQQLLSEAPPARPWYKKPLVLGGLAAAILLLLALSTCDLNEGTPTVEASSAPSEAAAPAKPEVAPDPSNAATPAFLAITPEQWINDPECKIADAVLATATEEDVHALADSGYYRADYVEGCIALFGLANIEQSDARAAYWFELPANKGIPQAMYFMGKLKETGAKKDGVFPEIAPDGLIAQSWYDKAAAVGNVAPPADAAANDQSEPAPQ